MPDKGSATSLSASCNELISDLGSDRAGTFDLYESHRTDRTQEFTTVAPITSLNSTSNRDDDISVTPDGLEVYVGSDRDPTCVLYASRAQKSEPFANIIATPMCGATVAAGPFITPDGLSLYYNTGPSVGAPWGTLLVSTRATTADAFVAGTPFASLQAGEPKGGPALSADELVIYFETGSPITISRRQPGQIVRPALAPTLPFQASMTPTSTKMRRTPLTGSSVTSRRGGAAPRTDIFVATRTCL